MTQIFFYHGASDRLAAAAAVIAKACAQKKSLLVYAPDPNVAGALDRVLWSANPTGFVPHVRAESALARETPVVIASDLQELPQDGAVAGILGRVEGVHSRRSGRWVSSARSEKRVTSASNCRATAPVGP